MEDTLVLKLLKPVESGKQVYSEISLREPTVDELDRAQRGGTSALGVTVLLAMYVSNVPEAAIRKFGMRDWMRIAAFLEGFLSGGLETGSAESPMSPDGTDGAPGTAAA